MLFLCQVASSNHCQPKNKNIKIIEIVGERMVVATPLGGYANQNSIQKQKKHLRKTPDLHEINHSNHFEEF